MGFDERAKKWDNKDRIERAKVISNEILKNIGLEKIKNALEFGCGTGLVSFNLKDEIEKIDLVDTSQGMIEVLEEKLAENNIKNMTASCNDITKYEHLQKKYDLIYTSMVLHHIEDINNILSIFYKKLKPKGQLIIIDLNKDNGEFHKSDLEFKGHNGFEVRKLETLLRNNNYNNIESYTFYRNKKYVEDKEILYSLFLLKCEK